MSDLFSTLPEPDQLTPEYFRDLWEHGNQGKRLSNATVKGYLARAKVFLKWWLTKSKSEEESRKIKQLLDELRAFKVGKTPTLTVEDLYTQSDLEKIFKACSHTRDLAMLKVLYESAFRASELLSMTFERVTFLDDGTATVIINGKTGTREVPIYRSVPALKAWMNVHPVGKGPVWVCIQHGAGPLGYTGLYEIVKDVLNRAGIREGKKKIIHSFRHTRATELVRLGMRGPALWKFMGWTNGSMEQVYVHLSNADVNNEVRSKIFGIDPVSAQPTPLLTSKKCPRCLHDNDDKSLVCAKCSLPLSNDLIVQRLTRTEDLEQRVEELTKTLTLVLQKLGMDNIQLPITTDNSGVSSISFDPLHNAPLKPLQDCVQTD